MVDVESTARWIDAVTGRADRQRDDANLSIRETGRDGLGLFRRERRLPNRSDHLAARALLAAFEDRVEPRLALQRAARRCGTQAGRHDAPGRRLAPLAADIAAHFGLDRMLGDQRLVGAMKR